MIGESLGQYRIIGLLGKGGMGEVYRATDTRLGRDVALKVLPAETAEDPERLARFQREARTVASLNHPNIVTLFSVEEANGIHFLTMELVDGESLDRLITPGGLPVDRVLAVATALADALAAAHDKGIIHRDLKSANLMLTRDGRVKVLDFGLAKEIRTDPDAATLAGQTQKGIVMGTPAYMSPEQVQGQALDHRTDIFSLGVILYEMASGQRPFQGSSSVALASAILRDKPPSLAKVRKTLPRSLARVIERCLEKSVGDRFPTARDLRGALSSVSIEATPESAVIPAVKPAPSPAQHQGEGFWIAVLPFKGRGASADLESLAEGLTEEILTGLSRFSYLRVVARSSTLRYAEDSSDVRAIGKELGARYVMEGSLRQAGSILRVAVQLLDTSTGTHLWAETYDRSFSSDTLFQLQDDLVPRIVSTVADMHGVLPRNMSEAVRKKATDQLTPYEALLHSFGYNERFTPAALDEARSCLERAVEQSPDNADCWAMLSLMYSNEYGHWDIQNPDSFDKALSSARKAVLAAPLHSLSHYALAQALFFRREFEASRTAAERAVSLNPMDGATAAFMGLLIAYSGEWERGCELANKGLQLNPNLPGMYNYTAWHEAYGRKDYRRALELALKLNTPDNFYQHAVLAMCYAQLGQMEAAHKALRQTLALKPDYAKMARHVHGKWIQQDLVEQLMDGLRKAGLEIADEAEAPKPDARAVSRSSGAQRADESFWVAVLPFKYKGANAELEALAEGLSEEVVIALSRFSYLRVISRSSTERYSSGSVDVRSVGKQLSARYVMEGSLRQAGPSLRLAVQLVDAETGAHLWAETYNRSFSLEDIFALQDDLVPRIVSTVADWYGVLPHSMSQAVRFKSPDQLTSYEAVLRSFGYFELITAEEHSAVRSALERAVEMEPGNADGWAMLSMIYGEEYRFGFNAQPDPLGRAVRAARRAVDTARSNNIAWLALAQALFFRKEFDGFHDAAERAIALNPMDGSTLEYLAHLIAFSGDWERGCGLAERARQLNPNHPVWYTAVQFLDAYRQGEYDRARQFVLKGNQLWHFFALALQAALFGQLGETESARETLRKILRLKPDFPATAQEEFAKWYPAELVEQLMEGLRKAGLKAEDDREEVISASVVQSSGEQRAEEGFWVAVLPFKCKGSNADLVALAGGLSAEIVTGLSRFSYLRVIAQGSTDQYLGETADVRAIGKELGARYVMEGSIRHAGTRLRLTVQLIDATTGAHLWAENYERTFSPEAIFELQDDLVPRIVSTVADVHGVLPRSMGQAVRERQPGDLSPYEAVLRSFAYFNRITAEEWAAAYSALEVAVRRAPGYSDAWALLALLCAQAHGQGFRLLADALGHGAAAARRAVETGPSNHLSYFSLAQVLFFQREFEAFRNAAERAASLNPLDGNSIAFLGEMLLYTGDHERGMALAGRAKQLNPNHPGWYWYADFYNAYRQGDYRAALEFALKVNLPGQWFNHAAVAAACGQLGDRAGAAKAIKDLLQVRPDFTTTVRADVEKWWGREYEESLIDGWQKAGLDIPGPGRAPAGEE